MSILISVKLLRENSSSVQTDHETMNSSWRGRKNPRSWLCIIVFVQFHFHTCLHETSECLTWRCVVKNVVGVFDHDVVVAGRRHGSIFFILIFLQKMLTGCQTGSTWQKGCGVTHSHSLLPWWEEKHLGVKEALRGVYGTKNRWCSESKVGGWVVHSLNT